MTRDFSSTQGKEFSVHAAPKGKGFSLQWSGSDLLHLHRIQPLGSFFQLKAHLIVLLNAVDQPGDVDEKRSPEISSLMNP